MLTNVIEMDRQKMRCNNTMGRGDGGQQRRLSSVVNLSHLACCSCLHIIGVAGLHHASHLYMMWLLMRLVIMSFCLSAACLHYVSRERVNPAHVWKFILISMENEFEDLHAGDILDQESLEYERNVYTRYSSK